MRANGKPEEKRKQTGNKPETFPFPHPPENEEDARRIMGIADNPDAHESAWLEIAEQVEDDLKG